MHPDWIGSDQGGHFGLYDYCISTTPTDCTWSVLRVRPLSTAFHIAAGLVFAATVLSAVALFSILASETGGGGLSEKTSGNSILKTTIVSTCTITRS